MKEKIFIFNDFNETHMLHGFKIHQTKGHMDDGSNFDREHFMIYSSLPNNPYSKILPFPLAKFV
jgi:hypothetical protein